LQVIAALEQRLRNVEAVLVLLLKKEQDSVAAVMDAPTWVTTATPLLAVEDYGNLGREEGDHHGRQSDTGAA